MSNGEMMTNPDTLPTWDEIFANLDAFIADRSIDETLARINDALNQ